MVYRRQKKKDIATKLQGQLKLYYEVLLLLKGNKFCIYYVLFYHTKESLNRHTLSHYLEGRKGKK